MKSSAKNVVTQEPADLAGPSTAEARLLKSRVLRGCNVHHRSTVFTQRVDLGRLDGVHTAAAGPVFPARFVERFASLKTSLPDGCLHAEFLAELNSAAGVPFERALLEAIRAVELAVSFTMRRLDTVEFATLVREERSPRVVELVWECHSGSLSRAVARVALAGLLELMPAPLRPDGAPGQDFTPLFRRLQRRARRRQWSSATAVLAMAAKKRGVPFETLAGSHLRLGDGVLQRVVSASMRAGLDLALIFPEGAPAGVPAALIVGDRGAAGLARELDGLLRAAGAAVGLATRKITTISGKPVDPTSLGRRGGTRFLLRDPRVEALVYAVAPRSVVERGLRLDGATAAAILDPKLGVDADAYRRGIDVCVSATTGSIVIGDDHPLAERLVGELEPQRLVLISPHGPGPLLVRHLSKGGCAVVRESTGSREIVTLRQFHDTAASIPVASLRSSTAQAGERRIGRAMFAAALAVGLGLAGAEIVAAVERRRYFRR